MQLSGSKVFSDTFGVVKERFGPLLGIWAVYSAIMLVMIGVFAGLFASVMMAGLSGMAGLNQQGSPLGGLGAGAIIGIFVFYVLFLVVIMAQYASLCAMASPLQRISFGDALRDGLRSGPTLIGVILLLILAYIVCALVIGLIGGALTMALGAAGGVVIMLLVLGGLLYAGCRLVALLPVVAVERVSGPFRVLSRTWSLSAGNVFKIFLINMVLIVLMLIVFGVSFAPMMGTMAQAQQTGGVPSFAGMGLAFVLQLVASIVVAIFGCALQSAIHAQLAGDSATNLDDTFA